MSDQNRVEEILKKAEVLLKGHFILTSGRHSNHYMQCAKILQYPQYTEELARILAAQYRDEKIDAVIGPATGGIIIAYEVARQLGVRNLFAEREEGKMTLRRGFQLQPESRVLVAEDVVTTGGTVLEVIELVNAWGARAAGVALLVDRSMGAADFGVKHTAAYTVDHHADFTSWTPEECPLCKEGKVPPVKPGSSVLRNIGVSF